MSESKRTGRTVYHLVHRGADDAWHLSRVDGGDVAAFATKSEALKDGERRGNEHLTRGERAQLVVHHADGSIEKEFTYGMDPRDIPG